LASAVFAATIFYYTGLAGGKRRFLNFTSYSMEPRILIIGIGGRTGSMFANELNSVSNVIGVGLDKEIDAIASGNIVISAGNLPRNIKCSNRTRKGIRAQCQKFSA